MDHDAAEGRHQAPTPIVSAPFSERPDPTDGIEATGSKFAIREWGGPGIGIGVPLHVHHADDEAWHVLEGTVVFRFEEGEVLAPAGSTVFVPAGAPHTFGNAGPGPARYLIFLTPALVELIDELHRTPREDHPAVYRKYASEPLE